MKEGFEFFFNFFGGPVETTMVGLMLFMTIKATLLYSEFKTNFKEIDKRFDEMDSKFTKRFDEMDSKFTKRFDEMDDKFTKRTDEMDARFTRRLDRLDEKVDRIFDYMVSGKIDAPRKLKQD